MPTTAADYNNVSVLSIKGELTGEDVEDFTRCANQCVADSHYEIVVDCSELEAVDSAGLESLVDLQNRCESDLGRVKLCGLNGVCAKILEITRLNRRFECFDELDEAVRSFR